MPWSPDRKRFATALLLFFTWVAMLTVLALVSSSRPAARTAPPHGVSSSVEK